MSLSTLIGVKLGLVDVGAVVAVVAKASTGWLVGFDCPKAGNAALRAVAEL